MRRRVFTIPSHVSLLLCLAAAGFWVRGHWVQDYAWKPGVTMTTSVPAVRVVCLGFSWLWIAGLFAVLPLARGLGVLNRCWFQRINGTCRQCGYSLTGNTSGVCPECGMPVSQRWETGA